MRMKVKQYIYDIVKTSGILLMVFFITLLIDNVFPSKSLVPAIFVLGVFLVSLFTSGYFYGIAAALISVLGVNYAFTFPYFAFNFSMNENLISAVVLISVTTLTSMLTTKLKKQERLKSEAEREKLRANLLRAISHDLRTPLTTIYGSSSTLLENYDELSKESQLKIIGGINKDAQWLIRMVENLLSVTRIDGNNVGIVRSPVAAEELIDSVLTKLKKHYPGQMVELNMPDDFVMVWAEPILIQQVLINLLENAIVHARGMTRLCLELRVNDDKVLFEVKDNGCGIPKDKLKQIYSGGIVSDGKPVDSKKRSMGIGLTVCSAIVKAHGSEMYAYNLEGGGMCFGFTLDTVREDDENE